MSKPPTYDRDVGKNWHLRFRLIIQELTEELELTQVQLTNSRKEIARSMKTIILGPPGTGKTTTLLKLVDDFIQNGIRPKQIGYFSFTKKAATEAADRAAEKFGLDKENDLPFFRTLHSYAFNQLGMTKEKMMKSEDYKEFGQKCGIPIKTAKYSTEDGTFNSDNEYLTIINTARVKRMDLLEYYDSRQNMLDIERNTLYLLAEELNKFKKKKV